MRIRQVGADAFVVNVESEASWALHVNKYMPRELTHMTTHYVLRLPEAGRPGALAATAGLLPLHYVVKPVTFMSDRIGSGIHQPWRQAPGSALQLPGDVADDYWFQRSLAAELLIEPSALEIFPAGPTLRRAAAVVLVRANPGTLLRVALHWAFAGEIALRSSAQARSALERHHLAGPEPDRQWLHGEANRLVVPQIMRVIAVDAACPASDADSPRSWRASRCSPLVRNYIAEYFPSIINEQPPSHPEIRTAIWLLSVDTPFDMDDEDELAMLMAQTFGLRSTGQPHASPRDWALLVDLPDDHPHGSWPPGQTPSDLRADLHTASGLDLRVVAITVTLMLKIMIESLIRDNRLWTLPALAAYAQHAFGQSLQIPLTFIAEHLVTSVGQMQDALRSESETAGAAPAAIERRKQIERVCHQRPFVQFDDGTILPVGVPDVAHRAIELCQEAHNGQNETPQQRSNRIGNTLGHLFEAHVKALCHSIRHGHFVADSNVVEAVMNREAGPRAKRADVVIGNIDGTYLVIEATKQNLLGGIRYAERDQLERWAAEHRSKHAQAVSTARHVHAIAAECNFPPPRAVATLVVADLPLLQSVGLSALLDSGQDNPPRPVVCSIPEFTHLIEWGQQDWSIPQIIRSWQHTGTHESLGLFLSRYPHR